MLIVAGLATLLAGAHSYPGERYILIRLFRRDNLPKLLGGVKFTKRTLRFAWHITSVACLGLASILVVLASSPGETERTQARLIASVFGVAWPPFSARAGVICLWIVFFAIAALAWFGYP